MNERRSHIDPTPDALLAFFGFKIPANLVDVLARLHRAFGQDWRRVQDVFERATGLILGGDNLRYQQTPPELFPFGHTGVDGEHYGYVVHAPELGVEDPPIGSLCPMDSDGVRFAGNGTLETIETLMSFQLSIDSDDRLLIEQVADLLQLAPDPSKAVRRYRPSGEGRTITPLVRPTWHHAQSSDGVGVLAPRSKFGETSIAPGATLEWYLRQAEEALSQGLAGSSLLYLREGYWWWWSERGTIETAVPMIKQAYLALGRDSLAEVTERQLRFVRR